MEKYIKILQIIPVGQLQNFAEHIQLLYQVRSSHPKQWNALPLSNMSIFETFKISGHSKAILESIYNTSWEQFNEFIDELYYHLNKAINIYNNIDIKIPYETNTQKLQNLLKTHFGENTTINLEIQNDLIGGFLVESGSTVIDASYVNILNKFIGEIHESCKA